jgi:putative FmdB family regulatory protein
MPIYEYTCMKCNKEFECIVIGSDRSVSCPECNSENVKRQMSACSFKSGGEYHHFLDDKDSSGQGIKEKFWFA